MKTLCQRDNNDVCTQCGDPVPPGLHKSCPAKNQDYAASQARAIKSLAWRWLRTVLRLDEKQACAFLDAPTGDLYKLSCGGNKMIPGHHCNAPSRMRWSDRLKLWRPGVCTPTGTCRDRNLGIQPCSSCPLYTSPRLLESV